jgi:hypothetical protein
MSEPTLDNLARSFERNYSGSLGWLVPGLSAGGWWPAAHPCHPWVGWPANRARPNVPVVQSSGKQDAQATAGSSGGPYAWLPIGARPGVGGPARAHDCAAGRLAPPGLAVRPLSCNMIAGGTDAHANRWARAPYPGLAAAPTCPTSGRPALAAGPERAWARATLAYYNRVGDPSV